MYFYPLKGALTGLGSEGLLGGGGGGTDSQGG